MPLQCRVAGLPEIDRAGEFPLRNPVFDFTYRNPTNVLHLFGYAGRVRINSREFRIRSGDLTCIQAESIYSVQSDDPGKHWCVHFHDPGDSSGGTFTLPDLVPLGGNVMFVREQIKKVASLHNSLGGDDRAALRQREARHRLKALLLSLHTMRGADTGARTGAPLDWDGLLSWVDDHLGSPVSTAELAAMAGVGATTMARKFRQRHHVTFGRYLLHRRIDRARALLTSTTLPVQDIGAAVGIADPQYFNKQFRKVADVSPTRYREEHRRYLDRDAEELAVRDGRWTGIE